jgi:hypothetical protein
MASSGWLAVAHLDKFNSSQTDDAKMKQHPKNALHLNSELKSNESSSSESTTMGIIFEKICSPKLNEKKFLNNPSG